MVLSMDSLALRLSGESLEASGVVPHEESSPFCDIDEVGEAVIEAEEPRWTGGIRGCPFILLKLVGLVVLTVLPPPLYDK